MLHPKIARQLSCKKASIRSALLKNVSYTVKAVNKNPFSIGDTSFKKGTTTLIFGAKGVVKAMNTNENINNGQSLLREVYVKDNLYNIGLKDSTYSIDIIPKVINSDLSSYVSLIKNVLVNPSKIVKRPDTIINKTPCYNFFIKGYDSVVNSNHNYTYQYILINKITLMPVYTKQIAAGDAEKGGYSLGRLEFYSETHFSGFRFNENINNSEFYFNRSGFELSNDKMLADGTPAPALKLKDLDNKEVSPTNLKNKILLVEFGATACGANPLANPMLNRLYKKYDTKDFLIMSIYSDETADQVKKYIAANKLEFPVYLGNKKIKKVFKTMGTPGFYLIDKQGKIVTSSNGYSDKLEQQLVTQIDKLK